jgi:hypothetical protein
MSAPAYQFGLQREKVAGALRRLADEVDAGDILPQEMSDTTSSSVGDYVLRKVFIKFGLRNP